MHDQDLDELLRYYSLRGLEDWRKKATGTLRMDANVCLPNRIADTEYMVLQTLNARYGAGNAEQLRFIPMPRYPLSDRGFQQSFFVPIRDENNELTFDLYLLVKGTNGIGFRFEPANPAGQTHDYAHVQLCRRMLRNTFDAKSIDWIPDSYPAFPTCASSATETFLYMATAVHGRSGGLLNLLAEILGVHGRAIQSRRYAELLQGMLG